MDQQIQGVIKCGRGEGGFEYKGHYRADLFFDRHGREFIVDDRPVVKLKAETEKELAEAERQLGEVKRERPSDFAAAQEGQDRVDRVKARLHALKTGYIDETGKPLTLTKKLFDYLREVNGKSLMFEPWDGGKRPPAAVDVKQLGPDERFRQLEAGQAELRGMFQELLGELKKK